MAVSQAIGALMGMFGLRMGLAVSPEAFPYGAMLFAWAFFMLALMASVLLWRENEWGISLTLAVQAPQIVVVSGGTASLLVLAGAYVRLLLPPDLLGIGLGFGGTANISLLFGELAGLTGATVDVSAIQRFRPPTDNPVLAINVVAAWMSWLLMRAWLATDGDPPPVQRSLADDQLP